MASADDFVSPGSVIWARRDLRQRWRSLVVLGILSALAAGLAMASLAGARRTQTVFPRLRAQTRSADAVVFPSQTGIFTGPWKPLHDKPYVESVAPWSLLFGAQDGEPGLMFAPVDGTWLNRVDRPVVVAGRMFDRTRWDEVVVDEGVAEQGVGVGSTFSFKFYANGKTDFDGIPPNGPTQKLRVVGVIRETSQFLFTDGMILASPGLLTHYQTLTRVENAHVRLRNPGKDMAKLKRDAPRVLKPGTPVLDLRQVEVRVSTAITVEQSALLLLAAAVAAAGLVFIGQALAGSVATIDTDAEVLRSIGFRPWDLLTAALLPHLVVATIGAVGGLAVALALSPRFPIGFAAKVDPVRGFRADWAVLVPGILLTGVLLVGGAATSAWLRQRQTGCSPEVSPRMDRLVRRAPVAVGLGATMAFDGGRGRRAVPVRPALVGAVVALLGVTATLTIRHGLDSALADPARVGVTWDATVAPNVEKAIDTSRPDRLVPSYTRKVAATSGVADVSVVWRAVDNVSGVGVALFAVNPVRGRIDLVTVKGRAPRSADEVAIGPATASQLGVDVGDTVKVGGRTLRIVGRALFPVDVHSGFDEGLWLTWPGLKAVTPPTDAKDGSGPSPSYAVRWRPGTGRGAGIARLTERLPGAGEIAPAVIPQELTNLRNVRTVPGVLAAFLVLLGVTTLVHVLVASVRARRHDFAILRTIGFNRRMSAVVVATHGTAVAIVGLAVGLPLGFVVGRSAWAWVSLQVPIVYASPLSLVLVVILAPAAVLVANAIAAWPARRAGRLQPAEVLRTE